MPRREKCPGKCLHAPEKGIVAKWENPKTGKNPKKPSLYGDKENRTMATNITKGKVPAAPDTPTEQTQNTPKKSVDEVSTLLRDFLQKGEDWERKGTSIPGISIIRMPATKTKGASLGIELNPVVNGAPTKRRGLTFLSLDEMESASDALADARSKVLMQSLIAVTGGKATVNKGSGIIDL